MANEFVAKVLTLRDQIQRIVICCVACLTVAAPSAGQTIRHMVQIRDIAPLRAPSLDGGVQWLNTAGPISLPQLRGKIVILDFWTYCCINCLQTLPDLKRLEAAYPNELVVVGVHAPKFLGERDSTNIREAIERHDVEHPVVNDANAVIAQKYQVSGWPSLRFIDPQGNVIATHGGEATFAMLDEFMRRTVAKYRRAGQLDETPLGFALEKYKSEPTPFRFPGKLVVDEESERLFVADSGHHRIVVLTLDGRLLDTIGTGQVGRTDGPAERATFSSPQGMALHEGQLYVADTENHLIRKVDLSRRAVTTVAGTGEQAQSAMVRATSRPTGIDLASPWDLRIIDDQLYIAMAGMHQIWRMQLDDNRLHSFAGSGAEDIVDGDLLPRMAYRAGAAAFAQPSGFANDSSHLYVADSEGSSIRAISIIGRGEVTTVLGTQHLPAAVRLFTFGDRDGPLRNALLQHPLGLAYRSGRLFVADTYNNKIKEIDLANGSIRTLAGDGQPGSDDDPARFNEPAGLAIAGTTLLVADTNNHAIRMVELGEKPIVSTLTLKGVTPPTPIATADAPDRRMPSTNFGHVRLRPTTRSLPVRVSIELPQGLKLNPDIPVTCSVRVTAGEALLANQAKSIRQEVSAASNPFGFSVPLSQITGSARLEITLDYFVCESRDAAICRMGTTRWTGRIELDTSESLSSLDLQHTYDPPASRR